MSSVLSLSIMIHYIAVCLYVFHTMFTNVTLASDFIYMLLLFFPFKHLLLCIYYITFTCVYYLCIYYITLPVCCGFICVSLCQSIKIKPTNMYIASARAQFKINTHRCWNWHHVHSRQVVSCPVQPRARHWSCVFWRDFSGVKRTCWTTGSWRSCLSLEVVSSIPAWSTIIYRFLCGFICVSLCQSIKIKPTNIYHYVFIDLYNESRGLATILVLMLLVLQCTDYK